MRIRTGKKSWALAVMFLAFLALNTHTAHAEEGFMVKSFWANQERAIGEVMDIFAIGGSKKKYADAMLRLVQSESGLMAYGVPFNDQRLVSRLARGLKRSEPEVFAYRVFKLELENYIGFKPDSPSDTLEGLTFKITEKDSLAKTKVGF